MAPLDNLLWDRNMLRELFDFEYRWEVYKSVAERKYGYYVLPVLYGDKFIARFEPGKDRANQALIIKKWWWEPGTKPSAAMRHALQLCFQRFRNYLGNDSLIIDDKTAKDSGLVWLQTEKR
jgi:hypothetical protein